MKYPDPYIPKSNSQLEVGSFWDVPLASGHYAVGVVLQKEPNSRCRFLAGLLNWIGPRPPLDSDLQDAILVRQGRVHIKTVKEVGGLVRGRLDLASLGIVPFIERDNGSPKAPIFQGYSLVSADALSLDARSALGVKSVWGYMMIKLYAEKYEKEIRA